MALKLIYTYIYIYIYIFIYNYIYYIYNYIQLYIYYYKIYYIYTNSPVNTIIRLSPPRSGDNKGQETFLAPSTNNQTRNTTHSAQTTFPFYQH